MRRARQSLRQIFAVPVLLAVLTAIGLLSALTGDGWRDALSWLTLAAPLLAVIWAMGFRQD
ncbi:hypothetical protein [Croceicoccus marinus]|jgi:hypothetical protein|uniref:DUF4175 domain-containing protein n=1 Tax=Croceicoccus marinus TaxID=450378 RepID=A0A7G6VVA7_9SPHN|nr:hypothetical protein [Croceicoccus marinus]QNE05672.1 hypothetical protein H4O24_03010 [Croceicoccus marinus]